MNGFLEALGLVGSALVVLAYFANQQGRLDSLDWRYASANLAGAVLILVSLAASWNTAAAVVELFWAAISFHSLLRGRAGRRRST